MILRTSPEFLFENSFGFSLSHNTSFHYNSFNIYHPTVFCFFFCRKLFYLSVSAGQSGLGKSTLVNTLFKSKVSRKSCTPNNEEKISKTVKLQTVSHGKSANSDFKDSTVCNEPAKASSFQATETPFFYPQHSHTRAHTHTHTNKHTN